MYVDSTLKMIVRDVVDDRDANGTHVKFLQDFNTVSFRAC